MDGKKCCSLCSDVLDESIKHLLCNGCLEKILEERGLSFPRSQISTEEHTPIDKDCKETNASRHVKEDQEELGSSSKRMRALIDEQKASTQNLILESDKLRSQIKAYDDYLWNNMTQHEEYLRTIHELADEHDTLIKDIIEERERLAEMVKELEVLKGGVKEKLPILNCAKSTRAAISAIDKLDQSFADLEKWCDLCQQNLPSAAIITASEKVLSVTKDALSLVDAKKEECDSKIPDLSNTNLTILEKMAKFCRRGTVTVKEFHAMPDSLKKSLQEGNVYAVQVKEGTPCYAALSVKKDEIYLHCLKEGEPPASAHTIKHKELLQTLNKASTIAFMDLAWGGSVRGRVHIQLSPETPLSRQFLRLCSGDLGPSYLHSKFFRKDSSGSIEYVSAGDYQNNDGSGGASVIDGVQMDNVSYKRSCNAGSVFLLCNQIDKTKSAQFSVMICEKPLQVTGFSFGVPSQSLPNKYVFGQVQEGLNVINEAANVININSVTIAECGVLLPR